MKKACAVIILILSVSSLALPAFSANGTWLNTGGTSPNWSNTNNWVLDAIPGSTTGTTSTDIATFNTAIGNNNYGSSADPLTIDSNRNIDGISFDTAAGNYNIGGTATHNPLLLTSGGTTQILNTLTATNALEAINAPLVIEGVDGTYTLSNNSANGAGAGAGTLNIGGGITGGASGATVLTLNGSNTNSNTISGIIANGNANSVAITKSGAGTWVLSGVNTYTGATTINAGTLEAGVSSQAFGVGSALTVASGATLDLGGYSETIGSLTGAGTVTSSATGNITLSTGADNSSTVFSGIIKNGSAASTGLTKAGTGTLTLTGANTYTGTTTISGGTLQIGNGGATGSLGTGAVIDNSFLTFDLSASPTLSNIISGTGSVTQSGAGTVTLSGVNTYSGATTVSGGTLAAGVATQAFGLASAVSIAVGGTLDLGGFDETIGSLSGAGTVTNSGTSDVTLTSGSDNTSTSFTGNIQDGGTNTVALTKEGNGTLTLSGDNTYSGNTTLNGGTLSLGSSTAIGAGTINFNGGILQYSASNTTDYSGQFSSAADQAYNIDTNGQDVTFGAALTSTGGELTKIGSGTLTLTGANTYTGTTTISGGTLQIGNGGATGSLGTGAVIDNSFLAFNLSTSPTISNAISGTGTVIKFGTGTLTLSGLNTYSGATQVSGGTLEAGVATQAFGLASAVSIAVGGTVDLGGFDETIGSLNGVGTVTNSGTNNATLTSGADNASTTYSGNIQDGGTNLLALTKEGNGTLTLSGDNTYSGDTTLNGGTLSLGSSTAIGAGTINFNGGILQYSASYTIDDSSQFSNAIDQAYNIDTNGQDVTFGAALTSTGGELTKIGSGTLTLTGANTYTGTTTISGGTLQIGNGGATGSLGTGAVIDNSFLAFNLSTSPTISNAISGTGTVIKFGTGTLTLSGLNTYSGATQVSGGTLEAGVATQAFGLASAVSIAVGGTVDLGGFDETIGSLNGDGTLTNSGTSDAILTTGADNASTTYSGNIQDGGTNAVALTKEGNGTLTLNGDNTYSGDTTLNGGTLSLGSSTAIGAGTINFNGGILQFSASNTTDYSGQFSNALDQAYNIDTNGQDVTFGTALISSGGTLTKYGLGTLTLSVANFYTGATTINAGTLQTEAPGAIPSISDITIAAPGTLDLDGNTTTIGSLSGAGTVTDNGMGIITLTTGDANSTTFSGTIEDGGGTTALVLQGTGTFTLSSANAYSGGTTINSGTLQVGDPHALGTGAVTNNATLALGTTDLILGGAYNQNAGSALNLTVNSPSSYGSISPTSASVVAASTVNVHVGGYIANNTQLEIINSGGTGIGSAPSTITSDDSLFSFTSSILNGNLYLIANNASTGFASLADNPNARAIGAVLDNVTNPNSDMQNVLTTMIHLSNAQITSALNTLGPEIDGGVIENSSATLNNFIGTNIERIHYVLSRESIINASLDKMEDALNQAESRYPANTGVSSGDEGVPRDIWAKPYGSYMTQGTRENIQGYDAWNAGTVVGLDRLVADNLTVGISGGYAYGRVDSDLNNAFTDITSAQGTVYAGYKDPNLNYFMDAAGSFAWNWYDGQRDIVVGSIDRTADSSYDGQQYGTYVDGGYNINMGQNIVFTPLSSLQWTHLSIGSYTETNADSLDLNVEKQNYDLLESGLGASISSPIKYDWGIFTPEFHTKWLYDFINDGMSLTSTFTGGGGSFTTNGANPARNAVNIGGKLTFDLKNDISLIADIDTELKDGFFGVYGSGSVRYKF